jgi:hypothetical protein
MAAAGGILSDFSAKEIVYLPRAGGSRTIRAIITYLRPQPMDGIYGGSRPQFELEVKNNTSTGISAKEIDTGGDKAQIPLRMYRSVRTVRIVEIVSQDRAILRLRAW